MGEKKRKKSKVNQYYFDYSLVFIIIFLIGFGLLMIYSTSSYKSLIDYGDAEKYLKKQLFNIAVSVLFIIFGYKVDYHAWRKYSGVIYVISLLSIVAVLSPIGKEVNGARRWINLGPASFQPAELAKLALILFMAAFICKKGKNIKRFSTLLEGGIIALIPALLIWKITNNMSSAIIVMGIAVVILFVASPRTGIFAAFGAIGVAGYFIVYNLASKAVMSGDGNFRMERIIAWVNPENYSGDAGYQTMQALYAIGSGGLFGKGLGKSLQKLGYIPEAQNDMIFSIICEELGLFGALVVILVFAFMLYRFVYIASNARDLFGALITMGVFGHIAIQVILNIAVVTNFIPNTGISLPFISYGGTSILFLMLEMGIVLNVSKQINMHN